MEGLSNNPAGIAGLLSLLGLCVKTVYDWWMARQKAAADRDKAAREDRSDVRSLLLRQVGELENRIRAAEDDMSRYRREMETVQRAYSDLRVEHEGLKREYVGLKREHEQLRREHDVLSREYAIVQAELVELRGKRP